MKKLYPEIPYLQRDELVLRRLEITDAKALEELTNNERVYRYLPTFLYEKKYSDPVYIIEHLYDECFEESLILGAFLDGEFCGLAEMYGFRDEVHKISVGYRFCERFWGKGIASRVLSMMIDHLYNETNIEIITASTMIENTASACVLKKNGFELVVHDTVEDWGFPSPTRVDKWIR